MARPSYPNKNGKVSKNMNGAMLLKPYDLNQVVQVHGLLTRHPPTPLTTDMLALAVGINRNKLHYGFKQLYGVTIHVFRVQQNMKRAKYLLTTTPHSIKTISVMVGYKSSSDFGYAFKKEFGVTPSTFRNQSAPFNNETEGV
jgi:AraC-like DNA-binding protein